METPPARHGKGAQNELRPLATPETSARKGDQSALLDSFCHVQRLDGSTASRSVLLVSLGDSDIVSHKGLNTGRPPGQISQLSRIVQL